MTRDDDFDIDDLLEAPYQTKTDSTKTKDAGKEETSPKSKDKKSESSKDRSTKGRSTSPKKKEHRRRSKDRSRSRDRDKKRRSGRSNSRERRRRSRSTSRDRSRRKSSPDRRPRRRSRSRSRERSPARKEVGHRSADGTISLRSDREREQENLTQEERDARTVFIMQLARNVTITDIQEFFNQVGQVRDVRFISDRNSRRSKGIGYVEFVDPASVTLAIKLSGQRLLGVPIMVSPTMAEKNRMAAQQAALVKREGPMKLYVGSLHFDITESMLQAIFEPFGVIDSVQLQYDPETNQSKGFGFVNFQSEDAAKRAMEQMDGFELAGRPMKVNTVSERTSEAMTILDEERAVKGGIEMNAQSRATLMQKLSHSHSAGMNVPSPSAMPTTPMGGSTCLILSNLFDPQKETDEDWEEDYRNDVLEEVAKLGIIVHISVDKISAEGNVYLKCLTGDVAGKVIQSFNGRWFAGRTIRAVPIPVANYSTMFPISTNAVRPIKAEAR